MRKSYAVVAFAVGCATAPLVHEVVTPRTAVAQTSARRWEQFCSYRVTAHDAVDELNPDLKEKGLQGWELATVSVGGATGGGTVFSYCFKRPLP